MHKAMAMEMGVIFPERLDTHSVVHALYHSPGKSRQGKSEYFASSLPDATTCAAIPEVKSSDFAWKEREHIRNKVKLPSTRQTKSTERHLG